MNCRDNKERECPSYPFCLGCGAYEGTSKDLDKQVEEFSESRTYFGRYRIATSEDIDNMRLLQEAFTRLEPYQQRLIEEYSELQRRYNKLKEFMSSDNETWVNLPSDEQQDMWYQFHAMNIYRMALRSRLERAHIAELFFPSPCCAG